MKGKIRVLDYFDDENDDDYVAKPKPRKFKKNLPDADQFKKQDKDRARSKRQMEKTAFLNEKVKVDE
jgi:hypothetical protein